MGERITILLVPITWLGLLYLHHAHLAFRELSKGGLVYMLVTEGWASDFLNCIFFVKSTITLR
jgi:hypothetical protein